MNNTYINESRLKCNDTNHTKTSVELIYSSPFAPFNEQRSTKEFCNICDKEILDRLQGKEYADINITKLITCHNKVKENG